MQTLHTLRYSRSPALTDGSRALSFSATIVQEQCSRLCATLSTLNTGIGCTLTGTAVQARGNNGASTGRAVLLQRQGNSVVAGYAPAPMYRPPKPSAPVAKVSLSFLLLIPAVSGSGGDVIMYIGTAT